MKNNLLKFGMSATVAVVGLAGMMSQSAQAATFTFNNGLSPTPPGLGAGTVNQYMIIGVDDEFENSGKPIQYSNHEAGQQSNRVPSNSNEDGGPSLDDGTVTLPTGANAGAISRFNAPTNFNDTKSSRGTNTRQFHNGDMAVVDPQGKFDIDNVDISATKGVDCAQGAAGCDGDSTNSFIDLTVDGTPNYQTFGGGAGQVGVNGNVNFAGLVGELQSVVNAIVSFANTATITTATLTGQNEINLGSGLHIIDIDPSTGTEFKLNDAALTIKGNADSRVIFRIAADSKLNVNNSSIFVGNNMSLNSVLFYSQGVRSTNDMLFSNAIVNGAAFWNIQPNFSGNADDPLDGGEIKISNAQMCTQLVGGVVNVSASRISECAPVDIPTPAVLPGLIGMSIAALYKRRGKGEKSPTE